MINDFVSFVDIKPKTNPRIVEIKSPAITFVSSSDETDEKLCDKAIDAPEIEAISAWLSLVGIPKNHAVTAHRIIVSIDAHIVIQAVSGLFPKSAIPETVSATLPLNNDITQTPAKFITDASIIAFFGESDFVDIHAAIAVGASVQPFTVTTPERRIIENNVIGSLIN